MVYVHIDEIMTTNKSRIVFYADDYVKEGLTFLASLDDRSLSKWMERLAKAKLAENKKVLPKDVQENFKETIAA